MWFDPPPVQPDWSEAERFLRKADKRMAAVIDRVGPCTLVSRGDPFVALFSESTARAVVSVAEDELDRLAELADEHGVPSLVLGEVADQPTLTVVDVLSVPLAELRAASESTLPALFD